ncbi:MAG: polysaccharide deacetylase family protein [Nocardioides sp.]|uniref:polysaccharide deacetylase family protein n=1 Tax=Nocardioides sp. TaxID=35761 RepID=UPI0039E4016B
MIGPRRLAGLSPDPHVALTYDDGPDRHSTPYLLDLLAEHDVHATFFLLGAYAAAERALLTRMVDEGHELAIHGWSHTCVARLSPARLRRELREAKATVAGLTGQPVRWYRPPYGVLAPGTVRAAEAVGLRTVLWSAWGRDWERRATPERVARSVGRTLRPGGTVLLHDTDRTATAGSWRTTLGATGLLLADRRVPWGPLRDHWADHRADHRAERSVAP